MSYRSRPDFSSEDKKEQPYLFSNGGVIRRKLTSKAGIFSSLFILIALIGVVAGVLLVQQNQDIRRLAGGGTNPEKPNIVFILVDDLDEDSVNTMLAAGKLPNIQSLINNGMRFANSFVSQSMCCPSRATLLSGKYSHNTGVYNVIGSESGMTAFNQNDNHYTNNLATWMDDADYFTGYIGKTMNPGINFPGANPDTTWPGWDYWRNITGYDSRPGQYEVFIGDNPTSIRPHVYQTKYAADSVSEFIDNFTDSSVTEDSFLAVVAPRAVHVQLHKWNLAVSSFDTLVVDPDQITPYDSLPIVSFNAFDHPNDYIVQQVIKGSPAVGYGMFVRINPQSQQEWDYLGNDADLFAGTVNLPVISFNAYVQPTIDLVRQHLLRGNQSQGYTLYYRDVDLGNPDWATWIEFGSDTDAFPNTGNLPIVSFDLTNLDGDSILQELIRGNSSQGYYRYSRSSIDGWGDWYNEGLLWDYGTGGGEITAYNNRYTGNGSVRTHVIRYAANNINQDVYFQDLKSIYQPESAVLGLDTETTIDYSMHKTEAEQFGGDGGDGPQSSGFPQLYYSGRMFADGAWGGHRPEQSFSLSDYGGQYPAGTLRTGGDPHGYLAIDPAYDLPTHKPSFNQVDCTNQPSWICDAWPNLNQETSPSNLLQKDYLRRLHLDRLESLISLDVLLGQVVNKLNQEGLYNNTLIVFTSDNGHFVGEHRLSNKIIHYEESLKIPLVIKPPNTQAGNLTNLNTVVNIDWGPTILDYAGLDWQSSNYNVDGRSLKPILETNTNLYADWRGWFLFEHHYPRGVNMNSAWDWAWGVPDHYGLRTGEELSDIDGKHRTYVNYFGTPTNPSAPQFTELYDMNIDPFQVNNLYNNQDNSVPATYEAQLAIYQAKLQELRNCEGLECRVLDSAAASPPIAAPDSLSRPETSVPRPTQPPALPKEKEQSDRKSGFSTFLTE